MQDLIQANGAKLWPLFEAGAMVYICGDARRMVSSSSSRTQQQQPDAAACAGCGQRVPRCCAQAAHGVRMHRYSVPAAPPPPTPFPRACVTQAPDVRAAFKDVARTYGGRSDDAAESWMGGLLESNRYLEDVWAG